MPPRQKEVKEESTYKILSKWFYDKSKFTSVPQDVLDSGEISPNYILYYFQTSPYILYLSDIFNNWDIYQMNLSDVLTLMKDIILKTSFRPRYVSRGKEKILKITNVLNKKFPYLKRYEIGLLVTKIDSLPDKDNIYETLGLGDTKKKKTSKENKKILKQAQPQEEIITLDDMMENF